jgi:hypothetical protein
MDTKEVKMLRRVRRHIYYAGPDTDDYLAVDIGLVQIYDEFEDGDEVEVLITIRKKG